VREAQLDTERMEVQLVRAAEAAGPQPLLLYATGDGGWRSADRGLFQHLVGWGYPVAGFSARHYLEHLGFEATTPAHVAMDYGHLIAFAKQELGLPGDTPTVLVGFSRGSGLAVVAAGQPELRSRLGGVLAVALGDEEEYARDRGPRRSGDPPEVSARELPALRPYDVLARLAGLPVAVIQSTGDGYLPAARAQELFGRDDEWRRFHAIQAGSHTFAGARDALYEQARLALEWIAAPRPRRDLAGIPRTK
jgi:pimeloyl-ACP methyl ester carboxylesterase